jgi:riboflavin kinase/FMN adenylyltransferase
MLVTRSKPAVALPAVALAVGNFDGVHIGHQAILARVREQAQARGLSPALLTFEPHPRELFTPEAAPTRLSTLREKLQLLSAAGIERVHVQRFSRAFAALTPQQFVQQLLLQSLRVRWLMVGEDFRFGAGRAGDVALLESLGREHGFVVERMPAVLAPLQGAAAAGAAAAAAGVAAAAQRVSSSAVRAALAAGDLPQARRLLGRDYVVSGRVVHGDKLGRELGFATANVQMKHNRPPLAGIYAVRMLGVPGGDANAGWPGVASLGVRPTVKTNGHPVLEVHLFDFKGNLYDLHVEVQFLHKIRDEAKYPDLAALTAQIARDCEQARAWLASH